MTKRLIILVMSLACLTSPAWARNRYQELNRQTTPTPIQALTANEQNMMASFDQGMKDYHIEDYDFAKPELVASTKVLHPESWQTWYVTAYNTLGVIYEFHSKENKHRAYAYLYYYLALQRDPNDSTANMYITYVASDRGQAMEILRKMKEEDKLGEEQYAEQKMSGSSTWTPTPSPTPQPHWFPPPPIGPGDQFIHYSVNTYLDMDSVGTNLYSAADIIARRRLDQYNTSADFDVRFAKNFSNSDSVDSLQLFLARISYSTPFLTFSAGRLDVGGALSPTEYFGNYMTMGLLRTDGFQLTLPLSFSLGVQDLASASSNSSAFTLFYFPSLLSAQYASYNTSQAYVLGQLRISFNLFKLPMILCLNAGQSGSDYFQYSVLSGDLAYDATLEMTIQNDFNLYSEFAVQDANHLNDTSVITAGIRANRIYTFGSFSIDEIGIEGQFPLDSSYNNSFTGGNLFNPSQSFLPQNSFYGHIKARISAVYIDAYLTNSVGDYTFGRLNSSNSTLTNSVGLTNQIQGLLIPFVSNSYSNLAFLLDFGVDF